jgi:hypothetical protein
MEKPFKLTLRVSLWTQIVMFLFALPFMAGIFLVLQKAIKDSLSLSNILLSLLILVCFAYLGLANALSTIQITENNVTVNVFYGRFRIGWDEVDKIGINGPLIALMGHGKRVVLSLAFAGKSKGKMLEFFNHQIEQRKIKFEENASPFPNTHQNSRIWW